MTELDDLIREQRNEQRQGPRQYREPHVALSLDALPAPDIGDAEGIRTWWKRAEHRNYLRKRTRNRRRGCKTHGYEFWRAYDKPNLGGQTGHCRVCKNEKDKQSYARRTRRTGSSDRGAAQRPATGDVPTS